MSTYQEIVGKRPGRRRINRPGIRRYTELKRFTISKTAFNRVVISLTPGDGLSFIRHAMGNEDMPMMSATDAHLIYHDIRRGV